MLSKDSSKIENWKKKADNYYNNTDSDKLKKDLEKAGFKVGDKKKR